MADIRPISKFLTLYVTERPEVPDPYDQRMAALSAQRPDLFDPAMAAALQGCEEQPKDRAPVAR